MGRLVTALIDYEEGRLDHEETVELFQQLVDNGLIRVLQGHYGRIAHDLIRFMKSLSPNSSSD